MWDLFRCFDMQRRKQGNKIGHATEQKRRKHEILENKPQNEEWWKWEGVIVTWLFFITFSNL